MRKFFTLLWLLCPVAALYYHFNEGQDQIIRVQARRHVEAIRELEKAREPDYARIIEEYDKLSGELPADEQPLVRHQIRLAKARARLEMLDVVGATDELTLLLRESAQTHGEDAAITRAIRETLGKAHYYAAYLLKTNGAAESEWRPFAERTRQIFRFLAEHQEPGALARYEERVAAEFDKTLNK
ncbi:MAG: hypothetical protein V4662_23205 [Verrucomicrobiota bacterium]